MAKKKRMKLGVLLRCHHRSKTLDIAMSEFFRYHDDLGIDVAMHVLADRPNFLVESVLKKYRKRLFGLKYAPFPLVSNQGCRFMEALNLQLDALRDAGCDWFTIADDDRWWEPTRADEHLKKCMEDPDVDLWYGQSLFIWDSPNLYNVNRHHDAVVLFRHRQGDRFPEDRVIQATEEIHDEAIVQGRTGRFPAPLLDYGTYDDQERNRVLKSFLNAGKDDQYVRSIEQPPKLEYLPFDNWKDLYSEWEPKNF